MAQDAGRVEKLLNFNLKTNSNANFVPIYLSDLPWKCEFLKGTDYLALVQVSLVLNKQ